MSKRLHSLALLLAILLLAASLSGCAATPAETFAPESSATISSAAETTAPESAAPETTAAPVDENRCGTSWIKIFGDRSLPAEGWLEPDQVGFYFKSEDGTPSVTVMTVSELLSMAEVHS